MFDPPKYHLDYRKIGDHKNIVLLFQIRKVYTEKNNKYKIYNIIIFVNLIHYLRLLHVSYRT